MKLCAYGCGDPATTRDHVTPRSQGGRRTVPCCLPCNTLKGDMSAEEWDRWRGTDEWREARRKLIARWDRKGWPSQLREQRDAWRRPRKKPKPRKPRRWPLREAAPIECRACGHDVSRRCPDGCPCRDRVVGP